MALRWCTAGSPLKFHGTRTSRCVAVAVHPTERIPAVEARFRTHGPVLGPHRRVIRVALGRVRTFVSSAVPPVPTLRAWASVRPVE